MARNRGLFHTSLATCLKTVKTYAEAKTPSDKLLAQIQSQYTQLTDKEKKLFIEHLEDKMKPYVENLELNHRDIEKNAKSNIFLHIMTTGVIIIGIAKLYQGIYPQSYKDIEPAVDITALVTLISIPLILAYDHYHGITASTNKKKGEATQNSHQSCPYFAIQKATYAPDFTEYSNLSYD